MTSWGSLVSRPDPGVLGDPPERERRVHNAPTQTFVPENINGTRNVTRAALRYYGDLETSLQPRMRMSLGYLRS